MIKSVLFSLIVILSYSSSAQSIMVGLGGGYGSDIKQLDLNTRVYYGLNEQICFGPEFSFFPTVIRGDESMQLNEYGFVVHYIFELKEKIGFYPLLGLNYSLEKNTHLGMTHSMNAWGASFGGGIHYTIRNFLPFVEYKYITGDLKQSTFSLGLIYNFRFGEEE